MIPKFHIATTNDLSPIDKTHLELLRHMKEVALEFIGKNHTIERAADYFHLGFHIPAATMIKHLHLHLLVGNLTLRGNIEFNRWLFNPIDNVIAQISQ